jgi:hypothetical protein
MKAKIESIPDILSCPVSMTEANQAILLYEGVYTVRRGSVDFKVQGDFQFVWFPNQIVDFRGTVIETSAGPNEDFFMQTVQVLVNETIIGSAYCYNLGVTGAKIYGSLVGEVVFGDSTVSVDKVSFAIPNLKELHGSAVRMIKGEWTAVINNRLKFENNDFIIILDKDAEFNDLNNSAKIRGGYILNYSGELTKKKGSISLNESQDILHCFSNFISFLNGRSISAMFRQGKFNEETVWMDYNSYYTESIKHVRSWTPHYRNDEFNGMWIVFSKMWKSKDERDFVISALNWYTQANNTVKFYGASIILAQTALELIYNKLIVEDKRIITGKDATNIAASNKIRLILSQLGLSSAIPITLSKLKTYANLSPDKNIDAPEIFVQIRNAIVHSQEEKRKKVASMDDRVLYESLQLSLWYVEVALLYIFGYKGYYYNRTNLSKWVGQGEEYVPWATPPTDTKGLHH